MNYDIYRDFDPHYWKYNRGCDEGYSCVFCNHEYRNRYDGCDVECYGCSKVCCPGCAIFCHDKSELIGCDPYSCSDTYVGKFNTEDLDILYEMVQNEKVDEDTINALADKYGYKKHKNAMKTLAEVVGKYYYCPDCVRKMNEDKYISNQEIVAYFKTKHPEEYKALVGDREVYDEA